MSVRGCKAPLPVGAPKDLKLYGLKLTVFQVPLHAFSSPGTLWQRLEFSYLASISAVKSVSSLTNCLVNFGPLLKL